MWILKGKTKDNQILFDYENMEVVHYKGFNVVSRIVVPYPATALMINDIIEKMNYGRF